MMSSGSSSSSTTTARPNWPPFTATQWQELEHQALIFKHMVAGVPIPSDLLFPLRRNNNLLESNTTFTSRLFPQHHQPLSWGCFQMGLGRKIDPEPGRCRRTDGKKWRCSKEAFPDSKYCERHMHRGRNRSRKPVEVTTASSSSSTSVNNAATPTPILTPSPSFYSGTSTTNTNFNNALSSVASHHDHQNLHQRQHHHQYPYYNTASPLHHSFIYPHCSSSRPPGNISSSSSSSLGIGIGFSSQNVENSNTHLGLDSVSYSQPDKDYRRDRHYYNGLKDEVLDERAFFPEASSGALRSINNNTTDNEDDDPWRFTPLRMSNSTSSSLTQQKERNCFDLQSGHSQFFPDFSKNQQHEQPCFVLGTDFKSVRDHERAEEGPHHHQRPLRHFFDEWPPKSSKDALFSTTTATQLSISMPCSDYPLNYFEGSIVVVVEEQRKAKRVLKNVGFTALPSQLLC
ncbi:hypothetical protein Scep_007957 [Stephania cephalantha]|uniref:Growth-regulating factor n=1 Tax=Stephania cephalantha TaxID=152367 RepID=A0AAP0PP85_9MAGN